MHFFGRAEPPLYGTKTCNARPAKEARPMRSVTDILIKATVPAAATLLATALPAPLIAQTAVTASLSLGTPVSQGNGHYTIPVNILTSPDSAPPQAFCFRVATSASVGELSIAHAGVCDG